MSGWPNLPFARLLCLAATLFATVPAWSETIRLRAGEHAGFSRIAIDLGSTTDWQLGRSETGYELRLSRPEVTFDLSQIYRLIPRTRLADIAPGATAGSLRFTLTCDCHATAFATGSGSLVIDFSDGPAAKNAPFETALEPPEVEAPAPVVVTTEPAAPPLPEAFLATAPSYKPAPIRDPRLDIFWTRMETGGSASAATGGSATARPTVEPGAIAAKSQPDHNPTITTVPASDVDITRLGILQPLPDPRVSAAEAQLLMQISRAASQGLVVAKTTQPRHPVAAGHDSPPPEAVAAPTAESDPAGGDLTHVVTSVDRDTLSSTPRMPVTAEGLVCLPDADVAVANWGDRRPAALLIAERRGPLVGEFDRPSEEAVLALARLYLFLGFGAESRAVLRAFPLQDDTLPLLDDMALILDGMAPSPTSPLAAMTDCDSAVALWAVLADADFSAATTVNHGAVILTFSGLPMHLRKTLGQPLSDRFLAAGDTDTARAIRDAIARAPGRTSATLGMIDARIDLARGNTLAGKAALEQIATSNDPAAPEALVMAVRMRLDREEPVAIRLADTAAALAYELQGEPIGPALSQAHILARASLRDYKQAFESYDRWVTGVPDSIQKETARDLWRSLADHADDATFLAMIFRPEAGFTAADPGVDLQFTLADRLVALGFTAEARPLLQAAAAQSAPGRRLLAQAALAEFDSATALAQLAGLDDPASGQIRARALAMAGDHAAAAAVFADAGFPEAAGAEAWRAGDWAVAAELGPEPMRGVLAEIGPLAPPDGATPAIAAAAAGAAGPAQMPDPDLPEAERGPIAQGRSLVAESRAARAAIGTLLAATEPATIGN